MYSLSAEEKALLEKAGINIDDLKKAIDKENVPKKPKGNKAPKNIDLTAKSGIVYIHCKCCGKDSIKYVDYIKRVGEEGFSLKTVKQPTYPVTGEHQFSVIRCDHCTGKEMELYTPNQLIEMINNLRKVIESN